VKPLMGGSDRHLVAEIEAAFAAVYASLRPYERGDGFASYTALDETDTRKLAQGIDALAEKISRVPAVILRAENAAAGA
jgi:iron uptake system component EfeO